MIGNNRKGNKRKFPPGSPLSYHVKDFNSQEDHRGVKGPPPRQIVDLEAYDKMVEKCNVLLLENCDLKDLLQHTKALVIAQERRIKRLMREIHNLKEHRKECRKRKKRHRSKFNNHNEII